MLVYEGKTTWDDNLIKIPSKNKDSN
jgi:hypothetical protein